MTNYKSQKIMSSIVFHNQLIINKGENPGYIYKLIKGAAVILDANANPIHALKAPKYLNLAEMLYECTATKTVQAEGRCEVLKVRVKDTHKQIIRKMKENGLRKSCFQAFEDIPSGCFYSLMHFAFTQIVERGKLLAVQCNKIYFILEGHAYVSKSSKLKLLKLNIGQILISFDENTSLQSESAPMKVASVCNKLAQTILGEHYEKIRILGSCQRSILESYDMRNQRLSLDLKKGREGTRSVIPKYFTNKIELKMERFDQYRRARSCFSACKLQRHEVKEENQKKFFEMMDLNRKKFGQDYVYKKRLEVSREVHSLSQGKQHNSLAQNDLELSIYELFSLKSHFGVIKRHPEISKFRQKEGHLVRRTGTSKKTFVSNRPSRANSKEA